MKKGNSKNPGKRRYKTPRLTRHGRLERVAYGMAFTIES